MSTHNNTLAHQAFASKDLTTALQWIPCPNGRDAIAKFTDGSVLLVTLDAEKATALP